MLTSEEGEDISSKDKHKFKQFAETLRMEKKIRINYSDENIYLDGRDIKKHPERRSLSEANDTRRNFNKKSFRDYGKNSEIIARNKF